MEQCAQFWINEYARKSVPTLAGAAYAVGFSVFTMLNPQVSIGLVMLLLMTGLIVRLSSAYQRHLAKDLWFMPEEKAWRLTHYQCYMLSLVNGLGVTGALFSVFLNAGGLVSYAAFAAMMIIALMAGAEMKKTEGAFE